MLNSRWAVLVWQLGFMALCSVLVLLSWQVLKPEGKFYPQSFSLYGDSIQNDDFRSDSI